jgi:hypothetical protein
MPVVLAYGGTQQAEKHLSIFHIQKDRAAVVSSLPDMVDPARELQARSTRHVSGSVAAQRFGPRV